MTEPTYAANPLKISLLLALFIITACSDVFNEVSPQKTRTVRSVNVADIPQAVQHLGTVLGNNPDVIRSSANNGQATDLNIDWSQIMELVDTLGKPIIPLP